MTFSFEELFLVPEMLDAKIVAGVGGLHKQICGCDIVEMADPWNWIIPGEIIFLSGVGLKNTEEDLKRLIEEMDKQSCVGLIIQKGDYIGKIPSAVNRLANHKNIPIIEIPFETRVVNITYNICRSLFMEERADTSMDRVLKEAMYLDYTEVIEERAKFFGYSPSHTYVSAAVEPDLSGAGKPILDEIIRYFKLYFEQGGVKVLYTQEETLITFLLPIEGGAEYKNYLRRNIEKVMGQLRENRQITISTGIGCLFHHMTKFKRSSMEAKEALKMLHACKKNNDIRMYDEMGIYRILFHVKDIRELERMLETTLGDLLHWDKNNESDLVNTLEIFLAEDCNISRTAEMLFVHRNTVKYKIQKIQEILNCDLKDVQTCFNLRLMFKIKRYLFR